MCVSKYPHRSPARLTSPWWIGLSGWIGGGREEREESSSISLRPERLMAMAKSNSSSLALAAALFVLASSLLVASGRRRKRRDDGHTLSDTFENDTTAQTHPVGVSEEYLPSHLRREIHKHRKRMSKVRAHLSGSRSVPRFLTSNNTSYARLLYFQ